jgi:hypothetical protein
MVFGIVSAIQILCEKWMERRLGIRASRGRHIFTGVVVATCCGVYLFGGVLPWYLHKMKSERFAQTWRDASDALRLGKYPLAEDLGSKALNYAESSATDKSHQVKCLVLIGTAAYKNGDNAKMETVFDQLSEVLESNQKSKDGGSSHDLGLTTIAGFYCDTLSTATGNQAIRLRNDLLKASPVFDENTLCKTPL